MRSFSFLAFVALTFCCWGVYGPVLHVGQELMGADGKLSSLRPFVCVGIAYFLIAVVFPLIVLYSAGEKGKWSTTGFIWSFVAGAIGAIGALGIILAFKFQGKPVYVMPLVFGLAPIVNTLVTMLMAGTARQASPIFFVGILLVAIGAGGVLSNKPTKQKKSPPAKVVRHDQQVQIADDQRQPVAWVVPQDDDPPTQKPQEPKADADPAKKTTKSKLQQMSVSVDEGNPVVAQPGGNSQTPNEGGPAHWQENAAPQREGAIAAPGDLQADAAAPALRRDLDPGTANDAEQPKEDSAAPAESEKSEPNLWIIASCIGVTALCWGAYGPVLHKGQAKMEGSRLRPFLCVGLAYFAIAVIIPLFLEGQFPKEPGGWDRYPGIGWSLLAGAAGAVGALGIIYAFNFGGKPLFVMPLVFGFAPVVNTLTETFSKSLMDQVSIYFLGSLAMVIVGAVMVLVFAPRAKPPAPVPATTE